MIKNTSGESIVGIIIGVLIIGFIILGVANLLINSKTMINEYYEIVQIKIIEMNTKKIANKIDLSNIAVGETFFIYKDSSVNEFSIFTGATNEEYKYIDSNGEKIDDLSNYIGNVYSRELIIERKDSSIGGVNHKIIKTTVNKYIQY